MNFILSSGTEILAVLSQRLRTQRLAQGFAQQDLAKRAGISLGALRKLETSGQCSMETLIRVVQALDLVQELEPLFTFKTQSIAQLEQAQAVHLRQRAPRRKKP